MSNPNINYITNQNPKNAKKAHPLVFISILLILFRFNFSHAQTPNFVPNLDSLKASCRFFYTKQAVADLTQFDYRTKGQVLNYLPSIGWNVAANSPIFTINTNGIFSGINNRRANIAQAKRIILVYETQMNAALIEVVQLHASLINQLNLYTASLKLLELERQKFLLIEKDYEKGIAQPSQYLTAQISFSTLENNLNARLFDLQKAKAELLIKAKKGDWVALPLSSFNVSLKFPIK